MILMLSISRLLIVSVRREAPSLILPARRSLIISSGVEVAKLHLKATSPPLTSMPMPIASKGPLPV